MSKYGYIGPDSATPTQSIENGNAGLFTVNEIFDLKKEGKYGHTNAGYRLLSVTNLSGSSTIIGDMTGYGQYLVFVRGVTFSEDAILHLRFSNDNGATLESGSTDYDYWHRELNDQGTIANTADTEDSEIQIGTTSEYTKPLDAHIELHHFDTPTTDAALTFQYVKTEDGGTIIDHGFGHGWYNTAEVINGIGFLPSAGTFSGGQVIVYGVNIK
tara:strand:+ start:971 stop:1612 length:642 start_codon:yes stop_codon:yes gene_type:complete